VPQNIGEWSFQKPLMPNSKKFAVKSKNGMKSRFWKSAQILTTFIFWCSQFRQIARRRMVQMIKSLTAREIFKACPEVKKQLWGGEFWSDGYFVSTVGAHATEEMIKNYVQNQGKLEENGQLRLF